MAHLLLMWFKVLYNNLYFPGLKMNPIARSHLKTTLNVGLFNQSPDALPDGAEFIVQGFDIKIGTGSAPDRDSDDDIDPGFKFPFRPAAATREILLGSAGL